MNISLDCISCFARQALEAARLVSNDPLVHEQIMRELLSWVSKIDFDRRPPVIAQHIHRRLRQISGVEDPYRAAKDRHNLVALGLYPKLKAKVEASPDPLSTAVQFAVTGNVMDLGAKGGLGESDILPLLEESAEQRIVGDMSFFGKTVAGARNILYLADNAGEIVFDRLLIEQLSPGRVTLAVRGGPVINDATLVDARVAGLHGIVEVVDNGSDAPGTIIDDCSEDFRDRFSRADLVIAKGQGNYETLSSEEQRIFFLFRAKCPVVAAHVGVPVGTNIMAPSESMFARVGGDL